MLGFFAPIAGTRPETLDRLQIATDRALEVVILWSPSSIRLRKWVFCSFQLVFELSHTLPLHFISDAQS